MLERTRFLGKPVQHRRRISRRPAWPLSAMGALAVVATMALLFGHSAPAPAGAQGLAAPPMLQVRLSASTDTATPGQVVTFAYAATPRDDLNPLNSVSLDFGDGQTAQLSLAASGPTSGSITHRYASPQTYSAALTATADDGASAATSVTLHVITIDAAGPQPGREGTGVVGQPVSFNATGSTVNDCGTIQSYQFDFGDGSPPVTGQEVAHAFTAPGTYTVTLTVTDCAGVTATSVSTIVISSGPEQVAG